MKRAAVATLEDMLFATYSLNKGRSCVAFSYLRDALLTSGILKARRMSSLLKSTSIHK